MDDGFLTDVAVTMAWKCAGVSASISALLLGAEGRRCVQVQSFQKAHSHMHVVVVTTSVFSLLLLAVAWGGNFCLCDHTCHDSKVVAALLAQPGLASFLFPTTWEVKVFERRLKVHGLCQRALTLDVAAVLIQYYVRSIVLRSVVLLASVQLRAFSQQQLSP